MEKLDEAHSALLWSALSRTRWLTDCPLEILCSSREEKWVLSQDYLYPPQLKLRIGQSYVPTGRVTVLGSATNDHKHYVTYDNHKHSELREIFR
jgi:hypothetical protein